MATFTNTLTISPSNSIQPLRRDSVRRGTIASISKDVRVNDYVELIKQQQQQRLLKRRHSMINMNSLKKPQTRQLSNSNLLSETNDNSTSTLTLSTTTTNTSTSSLYSPYYSELNTEIKNYMKYMESNSDLQQLDIQELKGMLLKQQQLLNQIELQQHEQQQQQHQQHQQHQHEQQKPISTTKSSLLTSFYQDFLLTIKKPSNMTHITILNNKTDLDTIFIIRGIFTTLEADYGLDKEMASMYQYRYSAHLNHVDRTTKFILKPQKEWKQDEQVEQCEDPHCQHQFNWFQRKHHCRSCGNIFCHSHSSNKLPLFKQDPSNPHISRVCDHCFISLVGSSCLEPLHTIA